MVLIKKDRIIIVNSIEISSSENNTKQNKTSNKRLEYLNLITCNLFHVLLVDLNSKIIKVYSLWK